jgi:hypothetical protein
MYMYIYLHIYIHINVSIYVYLRIKMFISMFVYIHMNIIKSTTYSGREDFTDMHHLFQWKYTENYNIIFKNGFRRITAKNKFPS